MSKQAVVASVVFVDVQTMLLDNLGSSSQCCCDGRIATVWQRLDENFLKPLGLARHAAKCLFRTPVRSYSKMTVLFP